MSNIPKFVKIKPGHQADLQKAVELWAPIARGVLGWKGQAEMFVLMGLDRELHLHSLKTKKRRIRIKITMKTLKHCAAQDVFQHFERTK